MQKKINLQSLIWKEGKYYVARCMNVEVSSFGKTREDAQTNLKEALALYFEDTPATNIVKIERPKVIKTSLCHA